MWLQNLLWHFIPWFPFFRSLSIFNWCLLWSTLSFIVPFPATFYNALFIIYSFQLWSYFHNFLVTFVSLFYSLSLILISCFRKKFTIHRRTKFCFLWKKPGPIKRFICVTCKKKKFLKLNNSVYVLLLLFCIHL